jgi:hypothetical protein
MSIAAVTGKRMPQCLQFELSFRFSLPSTRRRCREAVQQGPTIEAVVALTEVDLGT